MATLLFLHVVSAAGGALEDAEAAIKRRDYTTAARIIRPLAESGDATAQYNLGVFYDNGLYPFVAGWIGSTLTAHAEKARTVASCGFPRLPHFFDGTTLAFAKVVVVERLPIPPLSLMGLPQFAEFERANFSGVTYLDTYFLRSAVARNDHSFPRTHSHHPVATSRG